MAYSYIKYMGDGIKDTFSVPFPYILKDHVKITVNGIYAWVEWLSPNSVKITPAPADGALVSIERQTSHGTKLVDFEDGANLTEEQLDLANTQNFYMNQEVIDKYEQLVTAGLNAIGEDGVINIPPDSLLQQIVSDVVSSALYTELQSRIEELDIVSEVALQESLRADRAINRLRAQNDTIDGHYALIQEEQVARITADSANADAVLSVQTALDGNIATVQTHASSINGLQGQYTVKIDANGYVAGYGLAVYPKDDGANTSEFIILADQFAIVKPNAAPGETPIVPFVVGTSYGSSTVGINGQLIVNGTIYANAIAANQVTAEKINVASLSAISADLGSITTGSITFNYGSGKYMQLTKVGDYPLWFGAGTKNDANGIFYIKQDGTAKFSGALSAGSNFTVDAAGNVVMKSVTIRDSLNNLVFSTNTGMEWTKVVGAGKPANNATVGATFGVNVGGQMNRANISTYIANAAMHTALIEDLAVNTLKIAGNAVTIPIAASGGNATLDSGGAWSNLVSANITIPAGVGTASVLIQAFSVVNGLVFLAGSSADVVWKTLANFRILRDGVAITSEVTRASGYSTLVFKDSVAAGATYGYTLQGKAEAYITGSDRLVTSPYLTLTGVMR